MSGIVWLASYPKSGNTWFRIFLSNYLDEDDTPADINKLEKTPIASARRIFDEAVGIEASDLTVEEIERLRPKVHEMVASNLSETLFQKIHDAYTYVDEGVPIVSASATKGAIYIIRNPLDVAVSFAHHSGNTIDETINNMGDKDFAFCSKPRKLHNQLLQRLLTWSGHVTSWIEAPGLRLHIMRYEDMHLKPEETFSEAIRFAGHSVDLFRILKAIKNASFENLQDQEREKGFREKSPNSESFFRKGKIGSWRDVLTADQKERIVNDHREVMEQFGYLTESGKLTD